MDAQDMKVLIKAQQGEMAASVNPIKALMKP